MIDSTEATLTTKPPQLDTPPLTPDPVFQVEVIRDDEDFPMPRPPKPPDTQGTRDSSLHQRRSERATQLVGTLPDSSVDSAGDLQHVGRFGQGHPAGPTAN